MGTSLARTGTYSIVAVDAASGQMGIGVQTHWFNVGALVPWTEVGVGIAATQDGHGYYLVASDGGCSPLAAQRSKGRLAG